MTIRVLPPEIAARIAAGEVVERPASVVKELIENALDAGGRDITVEAMAGGAELIRVSDDGCGIGPDELEVAFQRHATSKLADDELLRISTLGFRGEALPAIAAVAEVEITSRREGDESAAFVLLRSGEVVESGQRGAPIGTTVLVRGLFERQPARRKFLRSAVSEGNQIASVVSHYALAYPAVRFSLQMDGRQSLVTSGSGDLRDAVAAVYGVDVAGTMLPVAPDDGRTVAVEGLIAPPEVSRAGRGYVSLFVNGRWVQSRRLVYAVEEAYRGMLMVGRYPLAVLHLRVPLDEVDVNVHPAKTEVRFRDESAAFGAVQRAVRTALLELAPVAAFATAGSALELSGQPSTPLLWEHARALDRDEGRGSEIEGPGATAETPRSALPALRVIGQFGSIYIIAEGPDGMYLIDQHAAHERVLVERFYRERIERRPEVQGLLEPLALELSPGQRAVVADQDELLREHGFEVEPFGEGSYLVRALPTSLASADARQAFVSFVDTMMEEGEGDKRDRVAMSLACHGAIRAGKTLSPEEMRELVTLLEASEAPNTCPHGRPTMLHMSAETLAREFGRR